MERVDKTGRSCQLGANLKELTCAELASEIEGIAFRREKAILVIGRPRKVRILILPAGEYKHLIAEVYGESLDREGVVFLDQKDIRSAETMTPLVTEQVDENWKPYALGVFILGGEVASYFVPENAAFRKLIGD